MSLLGADMLYRIHVRLCEVFQNEKLFGNISVILVGDLLQLPPVKASYIFQEPTKDFHLKAFHSASPLFSSFESHILRHNHRQGESREFANSLNRIREAKMNEDDVKLLETRMTSEEYLEDESMHIFYTNKEVNNHNEKMLEKLKGTEFVIKAIKYGPKGHESRHGTVDNTQFMNNLKIKEGARCVLIFNVDVIDGLVNGSSGTIIGLEMKEGDIFCIIVQFDDETCGKEQRTKYPNLSKKYEARNGTPIFRQELEYQVMSRKGYGHATRAKVQQFPIKLFYASTAHKMQGQTVKAGSKVVIHWHKNMTDGMAYVMLGRCEKLADIFISGDFHTDGIKCSSVALTETKRLSDEFDLLFKKSTEIRKKHWKISYLNIRSLSAHYLDLKSDNFILDSDMFGLGETWIDENTDFNFENFNSHFGSVGRGKGVAAFTKMVLTKDPSILKSDQFSAVNLSTLYIDVIFVYISKDINIEDLKAFLKKSIVQRKATVVIGDFNENFHENSRIARLMSSLNLQQHVKEPTHDKGNLIDHIYTNEVLEKRGFFIHKSAAYYSDHDILSIYVKK